jgi:hypothetical protein
VRLDEAKKIDSFRASDYCSTIEEVGAQEFESAIVDKLEREQRRRDYLYDRSVKGQI